MDLNTTITLNNGVEMPMFGLGVFRAAGDTTDAVTWALEAGYRHIDTARIYRNEEGVGNAIQASGIEREALWVTTKLWNDDHGYDAALSAYDDSLRALQLDYVE